jgi:hypothetical protein
MDELIKLLVKKTGISEDMARKVVPVVMDYLKNHLPAPLSSQLDGVLDDGEIGLDDLAKGLGGLLGKK